MARSASSPYPYPVSSTGNGAQTTHNEPLFTYEVCRDFLPRPKYTERLHRHFAEAIRYSSWSRCILWGKAGFGKRQLAIHFGTEYGQQSGRKVLWVDYEGFESFVRDYKQAYFALTGTQIWPSSPYGFSLHYMLSHIKHTLEQRHNDWFLVLLNANGDTENPASDSAGLCPADYLPTRGQTLVTSSFYHHKIGASNLDEPVIWMGLKLANTLNINVEGLERHEVDDYYENTCGGSRDDIEHIDCSRLFGLGFPRLALSFSHMRWLQLDPHRYARLFDSHFKRPNITKDELEIPHGINPMYPETLDIIWRNVTDVDNIATRLLLYISLFGPRHLPWNLLQQVRELSEINTTELLRSRNFLVAVGLLTVHISQNGDEDEINVHDLLHQWMRNRIREIYNGDGEYEHAMWEVVNTMANQFILHDAVRNSDRIWKIIGHIRRVTHMCTIHNLASSSCAALFAHFALFLFNQGAFVNMAERMINQAISTATLAERLCGELEHGGFCLASIREIRVRILLFLSRSREAKAELKRAVAETKTFPVEENQKMVVLRRFRDLEVEVAFLEDDFGAAISILEADLTQDYLTDFEKAKKHHWMAQAMIASGSLSSALRHSHMALSYWNGLPDKWTQIEMLKWVGWHTTILRRAGKWDAASLLLPNLLDHYLSLLLPTSEEIWRVACGLGRTKCLVQDHEALVVRMLSAVKVGELNGHSLTYCLMFLHDFAANLHAMGRLVEAEGICRHNVDVATHRKPPELGDNVPYNYAKDRILLVACLYDQGRRNEARAMRRLFKTQQGFNDNLTSVLRTRNEDESACLDAYCEALRIRRAEDDASLLDCSILHLGRALYRYGCLEDRLHEYGDPMFDIDNTGVGLARKSQVLHLLEYNLVYLGFFDRNGKSDDVWAQEEQTVLGQYFSFCECRRHRRRSGSLNPVELIEGSFLRQAFERDTNPKIKLRQLSITKWLRRALSHSPPHYKSESLSEVELKALDEKVAKKVDSETSCLVSEHCLAKFFEPKQQSNSSKFWTGNDLVHLDPKTGELTWTPFFLQEGDHELDSEHIAIPNAIDVPMIRITGADGAPAGPEIQDVSKQKLQMNITNYFPKVRVSFAGYPVCLGLKKIEEEGDNDEVELSLSEG